MSVVCSFSDERKSVFLNCHQHQPESVAISTLAMSEHTITRKYNQSVPAVQSCEELNGGRKFLDAHLKLPRL